MPTAVEVLPDAETLARRAAERFVACAAEAVRTQARFTIALSGGSTPRRLFALLADPDLPYRAAAPWERTHVFWSDERCVPPDHPDSNFRMAQETLLGHVSVPPDQVHRIAAERADAAAAYERTLGDVFDTLSAPRFDLALLGLGAEGHTASLFPGSPALAETQRWVVAVEVDQRVRRRVTLTPPVLNAAAQVVFLVSGAGKAEALRAVLGADRAPERWPAQIVQPAEGRVLWLVDADAGKLLPPADR